jgi:hypothetical protein
VSSAIPFLLSSPYTFTQNKKPDSRTPKLVLKSGQLPQGAVNIHFKSEARY